MRCAAQVWLLGASIAMAQALPPAPAASTAAVPPVLALDPGHAETVLDGHTRYWIDEGGQQTIEGIETAGASLPWAVRAPGQRHRIDGRALWLQFDARTRPGQRWFLVLGNSGLDSAELYYRDDSGDWVTQQAGDQRPVSQWQLPGREPTFELSPPTAEPVRYWLRIAHERVDFTAPLLLYSQAGLFTARENEQFLLGAYFGLALLLTLIAAANALVYRDRNFAAFAVYVFTLSAGQAAYVGIGAQHLWDHWLRWNEIATLVLPGVSAAAALWFVQVVTEPARFSRALELACWSTIAATLSAVALDAFLMSRASFALVTLLIGACLLVIVGLIGVAWRRGHDPQIRLIALGFLPVVVMALFPVARGLNLIPSSMLTRYGVLMGAALELPLLFYALTLRGSRRRESRKRTHELPYSDALTGLADRETLRRRLEDAIARAQSQKHTVALLIVRLSNYAAISAEMGPDVAERALVVATAVLRHSMTDIDLAARVGEQDFALLLDGPTTRQEATGRAQQVVARGLQHSGALPPLVTLKFHVAVALLPDAEVDAGRTLQWAHEAVQGMRSDARRAIRPINF